MDAFHLYLDSTDLTALKALLPNPLVYGVTTNQTLLKSTELKGTPPALVVWKLPERYIPVADACEAL